MSRRIFSPLQPPKTDDLTHVDRSATWSSGDVEAHKQQQQQQHQLESASGPAILKSSRPANPSRRKLLSLSRPSMRRGVSDPFTGGGKGRGRPRMPVPDFGQDEASVVTPTTGGAATGDAGYAGKGSTRVGGTLLAKKGSVYEILGASPSTPATMRATQFPRMRCVGWEGGAGRGREGSDSASPAHTTLRAMSGSDSDGEGNDDRMRSMCVCVGGGGQGGPRV